MARAGPRCRAREIRGPEIQETLKILLFSLVVISFAGSSHSQLVLDDVADEFESDQIKAGDTASEPTDPYTKMLQWGVDNMDKSSVAEQARAIREAIIFFSVHFFLFSLFTSEACTDLNSDG